MTMQTLRMATVGLLLAGAAPLLAQTAPPAPPAPPAAAADHGDMHGNFMRGRKGGGMFAGMSEAGRTTMREAMRAGGDPRADHAAVKAARDRMLAVLDAERLDTNALKRAMEDERKAAEATRERRQSAMLAGFTKLSAADRKAFVVSARAMQARMESRVGKMRGWGGPRPTAPDAPPSPTI